MGDNAPMRTLILFCGLLISSLASAAGIDQLKAFWANTHAAQGTFAQSVVAKSGRKPQNSTGIFMLARPGKLRWSYEKPYKRCSSPTARSYGPTISTSTRSRSARWTRRSAPARPRC